jgi:hypothetical protein
MSNAVNRSGFGEVPQQSHIAEEKIMLKEKDSTDGIYCDLEWVNSEGMTDIYVCSDCKRDQRVDGDHEPKKRVCVGPEAQKQRREDHASRGHKTGGAA